jgi:hypothetical protein
MGLLVSIGAAADAPAAPEGPSFTVATYLEPCPAGDICSSRDVTVAGDVAYLSHLPMPLPPL